MATRRSSQSGSGSLVLSDTAPLQPGSLFSLDGRDALVGPRFRGVRDVAAGWHAVGWSAAAAGGPTAEATGLDVDVGVRNVLLRYWAADESVHLEYDVQTDALRSQILSSCSSELVVRGKDTNGAAPSQHLVPYPIPLDPASYGAAGRKIQDVHEEQDDAGFAHTWKASVANLDALALAQANELIARIFDTTYTKTDSQPTSLWTDSLADVRAVGAVQSSEPAAAEGTGRLQHDAHGRAYWGAERDVTPLPEGPARIEAEPASLLHFTAFDLKRSWPADSSGTQRTRWSVDKSWLLEDVARRAGGEPNLLAELDILFLLFRTAHNGPCLERWRELVSLFCRSGERLGAPGSFALHPAVQALLGTVAGPSPTCAPALSSSDTTPRLTSLHASFLRTLCAHLAVLPPDFFRADVEGTRLEVFLRQELAALKSHLGASLSQVAVRAGAGGGGAASSATESAGGLDGHAAPRPDLLLPAYRALTHLTRSRFGWDLEGSKGEEELAMREAGIWVSGGGAGDGAKVNFDSDEEEGDGDEEEEDDDEDEEDRPVVVPFEEVEAALRDG